MRPFIAPFPTPRRTLGDRLRRAPRLRQAAVAVAQQRLRQDRQAQRQVGEDEELVPEDMPAIGFAMPAARRHADIPVGTVQ